MDERRDPIAGEQKLGTEYGAGQYKAGDYKGPEHKGTEHERTDPRLGREHDFPSGRHLSSREIEQELDHTRARIDERARELQDRLSPGQVFERVYDQLRASGGGHFFSNLARKASDNPLPITLSSIGIAWLMMASRRESDYEHAGNGHGRLAATGESLRSAKDKAREKARSAGRYVSERGRDLGHRMRSGTGRVQDSWQRALEDQPLVLGLLGIAAGAALGVVLPRTEVEDEWMGDASDEMKRKAVAKSRERIEGVRAEDPLREQ